jgi:agmatinase
MPFDPDAAAAPGTGIFGLPCTREESRIILIPVPYDATTSYRPGTADGPRAILDASAQVDLFDRRFGRVYEQGIFMIDEDPRVRRTSERAAAYARPIVAQGGATEDDSDAVSRINAAGEEINEYVDGQVEAVLRAGKVPGVVGGEHSVPFGAIQACADHVGASGGEGLGILHIDAHMDLRPAFEGFVWSHASIMYNVLERIPGVTKLVQIGIRDFGEGELEVAKRHAPRVDVHFDDDWDHKLLDGARFTDLCRAALAPLPKKIYVSFDIDALDPSVCPHTGTPVPGGLSFNQATIILDELRKTGREVIGFDLVEVAPGPGNANEPEWDANVGARILYKLCGVAAPRV